MSHSNGNPDPNNYDVNFYFDRIFDIVLAALKPSIETGATQLMTDDGPICKAMFMPVGLSPENIALVSVFFNPHYLTLAFSETTRAFYRKRRIFPLIEKKIRQYSPHTKIDKTSLDSNDQEQIEKKILEWAQKMMTNYGFSEDQLAIDLTGGTKPMSIGAQNAARSLDIPAFYLSVDYAHDTGEPVPGTESLLELIKRQSQTDEKLVFVIMPFNKEFDLVYECIEKSVTQAQLKCIRADKEVYSGIIMDKIRENIARAGIIIAELSEQNPNVFYELGLAHAWGKKVIMITQNIRSIPFDLKHWRMAIYDRSNINGLKEKLKTELAALKSA
jgi:hypothetical protein